jgi:hypothetical protein
VSFHSKTPFGKGSDEPAASRESYLRSLRICAVLWPQCPVPGTIAKTNLYVGAEAGQTNSRFLRSLQSWVSKAPYQNYVFVPACRMSYFKEDTFSQSRGLIDCTKMALIFGSGPGHAIALRHSGRNRSYITQHQFQNCNAFLGCFVRKHDLVEFCKSWLTQAATVC